MNNRSAYVLIEIIVSIMILSIVGIALLRVNSNQKRLYMLADKKLEFSRYVSLVLDRHTIDMHNKDINLYDLVKDRYSLKNSDEIKELKRIKIHYSQKYRSMVNMRQEDKSINILIDEIVLKNRDGVSKFLTVKQ